MCFKKKTSPKKVIYRNAACGFMDDKTCWDFYLRCFFCKGKHVFIVLNECTWSTCDRYTQCDEIC